MAVTDREQPQPPAAKSSARAFAAGPIDSSTEAKYTAITPCRLVDTRKAGGMVTNTAPRSFDAGNAGSLAGQGGNPAGCGIPAAAVAIQANVVAVGSAGSGFLKVYPAGAPAPAASFLNFRDGKAVANGGAITVGGISAVKRFTVLTSRTSHVVVDVSGYFIKPLWALVGPTGALLQGSRITAGSSLSPGYRGRLRPRRVELRVRRHTCLGPSQRVGPAADRRAQRGLRLAHQPVGNGDGQRVLSRGDLLTVTVPSCGGCLVQGPDTRRAQPHPPVAAMPFAAL